MPTVLDHYDIDGIGNGGPFDGFIEQGPSHTVVAEETFYCDSLTQEFSPGQTFAVNVVNYTPAAQSLIPWVISQSTNEALLFGAANSTTLSNKQIVSAIQGVVWYLDGQIAQTTITSGDSGTAAFANYLLGAAQTNPSSHYGVTGYALFDAGPNYQNAGGVLGQSQVAAVPEASSTLALGLPLAALFIRKRRA